MHSANLRRICLVALRCPSIMLGVTATRVRINAYLSRYANKWTSCWKFPRARHLPEFTQRRKLFKEQSRQFLHSCWSFPFDESDIRREAPKDRDVLLLVRLQAAISRITSTSIFSRGRPACLVSSNALSTATRPVTSSVASRCTTATARPHLHSLPQAAWPLLRRRQLPHPLNAHNTTLNLTTAFPHRAESP
jgi:hypothetical protein